MQDVADHEDALLDACHPDQFAAFHDAEGERFFDIGVFAGQQSFASAFEVLGRGGGNHHGLDVVIMQERIKAAGSGHGIPGRDRIQHFLAQVADGTQRPQVIEIAHQVAAPGATSHHRYVWCQDFLRSP